MVGSVIKIQPQHLSQLSCNSHLFPAFHSVFLHSQPYPTSLPHALDQMQASQQVMFQIDIFHTFPSSLLTFLHFSCFFRCFANVDPSAQFLVLIQPAQTYLHNSIMLKDLLLSLLILSVTVSSIHMNHEQALPGKTSPPQIPAGPVTIAADNGNYLTICTSNCGARYPNTDVAAIKPKIDSPTQVWTVEHVKNQVALKGSNGQYLTRCSICVTFAAFPDAAFANSKDIKPSSLWTVQLLPNGKYSLLSDNGKYLSRCTNCSSSDSGTVAYISENHAFSQNSQWTISPVVAATTKSFLSQNSQWNTKSQPVGSINLPKPGIVKIQADNGNYLNICKFCIFSKGSTVVESGSLSASEWKLERLGNKVTFLGNNLYYLTRCRACFTKSQKYPDSAFVTAFSNDDEPTRWTPTQMNNGSWAFQSDNGMYLSHCNNCVLGDFRDYGFVHSPTPVAWNLTYINPS